MKRLLSYSVVMFVITIILLLIIPLPAGLVDVAIILNMSLSMMILVITITIREPLEFSIFPSVLLLPRCSVWVSMFQPREISFLREVHQAVSLLPLVISF